MKTTTPDGVVIDVTDRRITVTGGPEMCALALGADLAARLTLGGVTYEFEASPKGVTLKARSGGVAWDRESLERAVEVASFAALTPIKARA